jgi:HAD superfamily hydrolase (TIGR01549 family)
VRWEAVFFDFDGVILDSMNIKTRAFAELFSPYGPEVEAQVVDYHIANGGVSRYEKFKYYYRELLDKPLSDEELIKLGERFSDIALNRILKADFIPNAQETLKELLEQSTPAFVVSGTPQEEMEIIIEKRQLSRYFVEVHGSPRKKKDIVLEIQARHGYHLNNCLFLGDAMSDYKAASETGTKFLGIVPSKQESPFPDGTNLSVNRVHL